MTKKGSQRGHIIPRSPSVKGLRTNSTTIGYDSYWLRQVPESHIPLPVFAVGNQMSFVDERLARLPIP